MFSQMPWVAARLHQCRFGLTGPEGGLHLKPTLVKTTCTQMQSALGLSCSKDHRHELVQGQATQASEEYSQRMANAIARVVCNPEGGGGKELRTKKNPPSGNHSERAGTGESQEDGRTQGNEQVCLTHTIGESGSWTNPQAPTTWNSVGHCVKGCTAFSSLSQTKSLPAHSPLCRVLVLGAPGSNEVPGVWRHQ